MSLDQIRWQQAKDKIIGMDRDRQQIGTISEKTVHAVVKNYYEPDEDHQEIPIEGKCADIYTADGRIIEIQTRAWNKLKDKLDIFLPSYDVTAVLPMPDHKQLIWIDPDTGELCKPGRNGRYYNMYAPLIEIYKIRKYLTSPNMHVRILKMDMIEYKLLSGKSKDRKRFGAERYDRIPTNLTEEIILDIPEDYMQFVPENLPEEFKAKDFAKAAKLSERSTGYIIGLLKEIGIIEKIGKAEKGAFVYKVKENY